MTNQTAETCPVKKGISVGVWQNAASLIVVTICSILEIFQMGMIS